LTANRREWLPKAIDCYKKQTYKNREMLVVASGSDVTDIVAAAEDPSIRLLTVPDCVIGAKRNFGCAAARGEIICTFDDDDYSAPGRIEHQVEILERTGKAVTAYHTVRFTDGRQSWIYAGKNYLTVVGLTLCFRKNWWEKYRFPELQRNEDGEFAKAALDHGQLVAADSEGMVTGSVHAQNTCVREVEKNPFRPVPVIELDITFSKDV
jgi:glycosyltransferase involved in cell wall biosynthesis